MKYEDLAAQESATLEQLEQLRSSKSRTYKHSSGAVVVLVATDAGVTASVTCPEMVTGNLSSDPISWLTTEQLRWVADCRELLERWIAGGAEPPESTAA